MDDSWTPCSTWSFGPGSLFSGESVLSPLVATPRSPSIVIDHAEQPEHFGQVSALEGQSTVSGPPFEAQQDPKEDRFPNNDQKEDSTALIEELLLGSVGLERVTTCLDMVQSIAPPSRGTIPFQIQHERLPTELQQQLVRLYFETAHLLCPAVNERQFQRWLIAEDKSLRPGPLNKVLLYAMMFIAFGYLDDQQVLQSSFDSVRTGQRYLFRCTQQLYNCVVSNHAGNIALVQTALILSHWSPYDLSKEVNDFWLDEAYRHAVIAGLHQSVDPMGRRIWWCVIVRNRMLALGLRRPHKLRHLSPSKLLDAVDFSMETASPARTDVYKAELFRLLCKMSNFMTAILMIKHSTVSWDPWNVSGRNNPSNSSQLLRTMEIVDSLSKWHGQANHFFGEMQEAGISQHFLTSLRTIRIIAHSCSIFLFEPHLRTSTPREPIHWLSNNLALCKVKAASTAIANEVSGLMATAEINDMPPTIPAWIILSVGLYSAEALSLNSCAQTGEESRQQQSLLRLIDGMSKRNDGAMYAMRVVEKIVASVQQTRTLQTHNRIEDQEGDLLIKAMSIAHTGLGMGLLIQCQF